jgi:hypothetical protein
MQDIYRNEFLGSGFDLPVLRRWEQACYLEHYLLPRLVSPVNKELAISIMSLLNMKQLEQINFWDSLGQVIIDAISLLFEFVGTSVWSAFEMVEKH